MINKVFQWTIAPLCNERQIGAAVLSSGSQTLGCCVMSAIEISWIILLIKH